MAPFDTLLMSNYLPISLLRHLRTQSQRKRGMDCSDFLSCTGVSWSSGSPLPDLCQSAFRKEMKKWLVSALSRCWSGKFLSYLATFCILEETSLTRKLKVCGPKMKRSAADGLPGEARPDLGSWHQCFSGYEKRQGFGLIKSTWKHLTVWRPVPGFSQSTGCCRGPALVDPG